jgi:hypothetical protein
LPAYASLLCYNEPAAVARYTERAPERGYRYLKLHQIDVPSVQAACDVAGADIPITIDTNYLHPTTPLDLALCLSSLAMTGDTRHWKSA